MIEKLHAILGEIAARRKRQRLDAGLVIIWWSGLFIGLMLWMSGLAVGRFLPALIITLCLGSIGVFIWSRRGLGDPRLIAKQIEHKHPNLQTALLAALDQNPDPASGTLTFLQKRLILQSLSSAERDHWLDLIPRPRLSGLRMLHLVGLLLFFLSAIIMLIARPSETQVAGAKDTPSAIIDIAVDPGDVEIERGSSLTIQARFDKNPPAEAILEVTDESGVRSMAMTRPFSDPIYQFRLSAVPAPLTYRVLIPEGASRAFQVRVFDLPALKQSQVVLHFPEHLGKEPQTIKDPNAFQVPEQTRMELSLTANQPGLTAKLVAKDRKPLDLTADSANHHVSEVLTKSVRYEIVLTDSAGRRNHRKDVLDIKVIPNKPPFVQVLLPRKKDKVTPIQEVRLEARIKDDSGITAHGLRYTLDGRNWEDIEGSPTPGEKQPVLSKLIDLEAAGAKPNDILMWNAWAEDIGPDGKKRRVTGDIHLVQVRHFDEEFYQKKGPPGNCQCIKLIEIQTRILNSTWSMRREHAEITDTAPPLKELETLHQSQEIAIGIASDSLASENDPEARAILSNAKQEMQEAAVQLAEAKSKISAAPLEPAILHEQEALRHLYQLLDFRNLIMQGEEGEPPLFSEDKPKEDLELKPMDSPYKSEKSAKPELAKEAIEALETLKRLDELAKRQRDLTEEMKALQMAANQADTAEKKAEVERRLKQLREQQRELLADVDKLQQKTSDNTSEQQKLALDEAREKAQQANQQLDDKKLGDAIAAGRRAQETLEQLHDDFRETSAAKLAEQLRDLRQDARDLAERQRQLAENPSQTPSRTQTRLADSNSEAALQRENYQKLVESLQETAETADRAEPLVAKDLIEALRQADQNGIAKALEQSGQPGNEQANKQASEGIAQLTRQIETAAERILGNEAQALRYAREEINRLAEQAGAKPGDRKQPGEGKSPAPGNKPGEGQGQSQTAANTPGQGQGKGQSPSEGQGQGKGQTASQSQGQSQSQGAGNSPSQAQSSSTSHGQGGASGTFSGSGAISGPGYQEWRDRLADLEAVVTDPEAQSAVARARKAANDMRKDFKRHSKEPDPTRIEHEILRPLAEAADALDTRLHELDRKDPLAPVGRDPVPDRYDEIVRRYFQELGQ